MAEYCSKCRPDQRHVDIDLFQIALELPIGRSESFICEGCNLRGLYKDEYSVLHLVRTINGDPVLERVKLEDLMYV